MIATRSSRRRTFCATSTASHQLGQSEQTRRKFIEFITETCELTGGAIVDPIVRDHAIGDHEDNHILALAKDPAVDADVIVSSDHHLIDLGPAWNGRLMMRPRQFTSHMLRSPVQRTAQPAPVQQPPQQHAAPKPAPKRVSDAFPELRGVHLDRFGLAGSSAPAKDDDLQRWAHPGTPRNFAVNPWECGQRGHRA